MSGSVKQFAIASLVVIILEEATSSHVGAKTANPDEYSYMWLSNDVSDLGPSRRIIGRDRKADVSKHFYTVFNRPLRSEEVFVAPYNDGTPVFQPPTGPTELANDGYDQQVLRRPAKVWQKYGSTRLGYY